MDYLLGVSLSFPPAINIFPSQTGRWRSAQDVLGSDSFGAPEGLWINSGQALLWLSPAVAESELQTQRRKIPVIQKLHTWAEVVLKLQEGDRAQPSRLLHS